METLDAPDSGQQELPRAPGPGPIARNAIGVLQSFKAAIATLNYKTDLSDQQIQLLPKLQDELTRFKLWSGNLAAHQTGPISLDYRLREAPHLLDQVNYLLEDTRHSLHDLLPLINPATVTEQSVSAVDDDSDSFTDSEPDNDNTPETRLSVLCLDIGEAVDCLLRLSVAIANPAPHERFRKLGEGPDISYREPHDIAYVTDKIPKMDPKLAEVLGRAITRRRQFFQYRKAHHDKLAQGLEEPMVNEMADDENRTQIVSKTIASSLPEQWKGQTDVDLQNVVIDEDARSDTVMTQTSYATSAGFPLDASDERILEPPPPLRVPPLPTDAERGYFSCPFCYRMISVTTRAGWK